MDNNWRFTTKSVTKYNPIYRNEKGQYTKNEWLGFFQIGDKIEGETLTVKSYLEVEEKYIKAAIWFFKFHNCSRIVLNQVEKGGFSEYIYEDRDELYLVYKNIASGQSCSIEDLPTIIKLILREIIWGELFCDKLSDAAVRFGHDYYMYFNSSKDMSNLFFEIEKLGLYVD